MPGGGSALERRGALAAFAVGIALIAFVLVVVASRSSWRRVGYNGTPVQLAVGVLPAGAVGCQPHEGIAADTSAVQVHATPAGTGRTGMRVILQRAGGYAGTGVAGTVAKNGTIVAALAHPVKTATSVSLCVWNTGQTGIVLYGAAVGAVDQMRVSVHGNYTGTLVGRARVDDLLSARPRPLWSVIGMLPQRIATAVGSALAPWLVVGGLVVVLLVAGVLLAGSTAARSRRELLLVGLATFAIGAVWAGITPAFQKTDETAHFAYVQAFAELGRPPTRFADTGLLSAQTTCWYNGLGVLHYRFFEEERPPWAAQTRRALDRSCAGLSNSYNGAMYMAIQPPAYYALAAGAYKLASGMALPTRLLFARLLSVLLATIAVVCTYLLVRELIRGSVWPARAGALALVLQPVLMFNESGVNADALVVAVASAIALLAARAWRRGLTLRRALTLGALVGVGVLSKTNFLALLPSVVLLAVALFCSGDPGARMLRAKRLGGGGVLAGAIFGAYALVNDLAWHRGLTYRDVSYGGAGGSLHRLAEFTWQFFLPRFSGMHNLVGGSGVPFLELIENSTTRFGWWNDYGLANGWMPILMVIGILIAAVGTAYILPRARRRPWPVVVSVGCGLLFLAALVWAGYEFSLGTGVDGIMPRHALPVICLWGLLVGCAVAAVRPRWRPAATGVLASVFLGHTIVALATTTSRFYL